MEYMLDTNICIYIIKKRPLVVLEKLQTRKITDIAISSITLSELKYGVEKSMNRERNRLALAEFIVPFEILDFGVMATNEYGKIRADLEKQGSPIGCLDTLIAAHALSEKLTLITNNEKEFCRVKNLKVENWTRNPI